MGYHTYHGDRSRGGAAAGEPHLDPPQEIWTSALDGVVFAQPLVAGGKVIAATSADTVYALDLATGRPVWQRHLGTPVPRSELPCGTIDPSGITSTPVIDASSQTVYVAARVEPVHHELFALDLATGSVKFHIPIDGSGLAPRNHQQRGALGFGNGRVYIPFGGNNGDCGQYTGYVVGVPATGSGDRVMYRVPTRREGGIWAPSGVAIDPAGEVWVAVGNADSTTGFDYGNSVLRLDPDLNLLDYWAPADWASLSRLDLDIGSVGPLLLGAGMVFQAGKAGVGYLLRAGALGGIGGEAYRQPVCAGAFGSMAHQPPYVYVPCRDGLVALQVDLATATFKVAWRAGGRQLNSPVVAGGSVWSVDTDAGVLFQFDAKSGSLQSRTSLGGSTIAHFITPTPFGGRIYVSSRNRIIALG